MSVVQYSYLGKSGLRVSNVALGTWITFGGQVTEEMAEEMLTLAYESGINVFDTAEVYASGKAETVLGNILKKKAWRRSSYLITTKIYWGGKAETEKGLNRKHIIEGLRASLNRLQLEYVDIVFANKSDSLTTMEGKMADSTLPPGVPVGRIFKVEEIVRAFTFVINQGWAMYWGTSRWSSTEIMEAYSVARQFNLIPPTVEQSEYNFFQREKVECQLPELYHKIGMGTMSWSPLACGVLSGKYEDGIPVHSRAALKHCQWLKDRILSEDGKMQQQKLRELACIASKLKCSLAQLAIAWCLKNENIQCVVLGASNVDQLYQNIQAIRYVPRISSSISAQIEKILSNAPVNGTRLQ